MLTDDERKERNRLSCKKWRENNPEYNRERQAKWYAANRNDVISRARQWQASNPERANALIREGKWRKQGITGMTMEQYQDMVMVCSAVCEICQKPSIKGAKGRALDLDHDHATNEARGLLCLPCNRKLGRIDKHGLFGPHKCPHNFVVKAFIYLLHAKVRLGVGGFWVSSAPAPQ
jgi:hypothetical protein